MTSRATSSGLLIDGEDYFSALYRAASAARDFILLAGWQFDTTVPLLRGEARDRAGGDVRLLPFLRSLCQANPNLQIRILCWDYSPAFAFQRQWWQDFRFNRAAPDQISFLFDDRTAVGGSHHQKFAVVDGALAFVGSMDICMGRWDQRRHARRCEERCELHGEDVAGPYHEVQSYVTGPVVRDLQELFVARWLSAGGPPLQLPPARDEVPVDLRPSIELGAAEVGLSRTMGRTLVPEQASIREIEHLYVDAIARAQRSIYIETQYFGGRAVYGALEARLRQPSRPPLDVAIICPREMHSFSERMAMQEAQDEMARAVRAAGADAGHSVGIYATVACEGADVVQTYIHSKVMAVDDCFLTVGSANLNNRSFGLDSELNVSWEAEPGEQGAALRSAIRAARVSLMAEHVGLEGDEVARALQAPRHVRFLDDVARAQKGRLRCYAPDSAGVAPRPPLRATFSLLDPEHPLEEYAFESLAPARRDAVASGRRVVRRKLAALGRRTRQIAANRPRNVARSPDLLWTLLVRVLRRVVLPLLGLALVAWLIWIGASLLVGLV